ncbi:MAG: peptidase [Acidobacteria bacterium RIFCSPLOWO2_02_FULL_68_18]|nr:MAG: peptidase [Acidobacteria bacterium RIFCSPLOWO2_02_FULL_68_18]OFW52196.1 MAG: peptidase [Acidobacteria bacterium RIFCSPLOWO2_12_FULL_68_19]
MGAAILRAARRAACLLAALVLSASPAAADANIVIVNNNAPGVGFNDPTPAVPVGGNPGTTVGQQRLIAFQHAAALWGATLDSRVEIRVLSSFEPLACTASTAVLGSAGSIFIFSDFGSVGSFPGPLLPNVWHPSALADKRAGVELNPGESDIRARFNSKLGQPGCLDGTTWYYGLDTNEAVNQIDLVAMLLHEFAHGLGFSQFASLTNGTRILDRGDVYGANLLDTSTFKYWNEMSDAERAASAINARRVVWDGAGVHAAVPAVLAPGTPILTVNSPLSIAGIYAVGAASFGPPLSSPGVNGEIVQAIDGGASTSDACSEVTNPAVVAGRIALVDRGTCAFVVKAKNVQAAGAIAMIVADNAAGAPPAGLGGVDPTITIPSVRITQTDGNTIKAQLAIGVSATLGIDLALRSGADQQGRVYVNATNPVQPAFSISHWDSLSAPSQLMEPVINADLTHSLQPPDDLTVPLLRDVGWFPDADNDGRADDHDACATSDVSPTVVIGGEDTGVTNVMLDTGCTLADYIAAAGADAANHGGFVSAVAHLATTWRDAGLITGAARGQIQSAAAHSSIGD